MTKIATYREIPELLRKKEEFRGHTMAARWMNRKREQTLMLVPFDAAIKDPLCPVYVVSSYVTPIAYYIPGHPPWVTGRKYSRTTTRQQNLCRTYL